MTASKIAFIGLGNMGGGMAANQAKAGHAVAAFDLSAAALEPPPASPGRAVADAPPVAQALTFAASACGLPCPLAGDTPRARHASTAHAARGSNRIRCRRPVPTRPLRSSALAGTGRRRVVPSEERPASVQAFPLQPIRLAAAAQTG